MTESNTRGRLLDEAENLFARNGFNGVSIRDIAAAADVNVAAVNYHFGSKENLYKQVLERRVTPKRERLLEALAELEERGGADLEGLMRAFVTSFLEDKIRGPGGVMSLRLISREILDPGIGAQVLLDEMIRPVRDRMNALLAAALPELDQRRIQLLMGSVVGQIIYFAMNWHGKLATRADSEGENPLPYIADDLDTYITLVIDHVVRVALAGAEVMRKEAGS